jgi:hypothetical protein
VATGAIGQNDNISHAILWRPIIAPPNNIIDINDKLPSTNTKAEAHGINKHLQVVGWNISPLGFAFRYDDASKVAVNLNDEIRSDLGWTLDNASKINDFGQIIGTGTHNGAGAAFLLTPNR